jgi:hypothetical protein
MTSLLLWNMLIVRTGRSVGLRHENVMVAQPRKKTNAVMSGKRSSLATKYIIYRHLELHLTPMHLQT